ncbi:MAG: MFS transporter [Planctomycetes bacterium]|nr:MFS transporter [Planctomycetota bacterium]
MPPGEKRAARSQIEFSDTAWDHSGDIELHATKRSKFLIIFLTVFVHLIGFGIVIPLLPLYTKSFGASSATAGWLIASYSIFQFLCAPLLGRLSDRVGRRPVLILCMAGTVLGFLLMGLADCLWLVFLGRIIDGITGGNISTAQAYIADITKPEERSKGMGIIGVAFGLGFIFGPAIAGMLAQISMAAPLLFAAGLAFVNTLALAFYLPESLPREKRQTTRQDVPLSEVFAGGQARIQGLLMATYFLETVAFALLTTTYPLFTERAFGYGVKENGYLFASIGVLGAIIQGGLLGRLVKRWGEKALIVIGAIFSIGGFVMLPLGTTTQLLWTATAAIGVGHGLMTAPLNGLASRNAAPALQGRVLGLMASAASLGRIVGPILGGGLLLVGALPEENQYGQAAYFTSAGLVVVTVILIGLFRGTTPKEVIRHR